ncbi:tRNA (guanine(37)-N1)-methyltransferase [Uranotaenia lowii]|uniref:tRNA (guanine(37)-N1)-methyltransferase n=1 Tax=Uranotaenia lowii TaxID=190385 RepID=UPI002479B4D7|nr:tRNA (guanine(37)-N1)-methyltransferase [Uranotaenia lowii]
MQFRVPGNVSKGIILRLLPARSRHYFRNMDCPELCPPAAVRGMTFLDRESFTKQISVPHLSIPKGLNINQICRMVKTVMLKMQQYRPVRSEESKIALHPLGVRDWSDLEKLGLVEKDLGTDCLKWEEITIGYNNWGYDEILKAILPVDKETLSSFSKVGHIVHLNLKDHLLPYKKLIGDVIKDKVPGCKTVVNKLVTIDNTYRNFQMELLAGEPKYDVEVKENGVTFEFDFSKVYWNPRLATEHEKIIKMLNKEDILIDVYAGVGPFSVPAAKKGCSVFANDLNPDSYGALAKNCAKNKVQSRVKCHNKDGIDFIKQELKQILFEKSTDNSFNGTIHVTMNLPALAVEHLPNFVGLFSKEPVAISKYPLVHLYCFAKGIEDKKDIARQLVDEKMQISLKDNLKEIAFVRNVSPNKDMMRVSFYLTEEILFSNITCQKRQPSDLENDQSSKRLCNNVKNRNQQKQVAKKAKNIFAVNQGKKNNPKKAKEVASKLKKMNVYDKREKTDKNFQELHSKVVNKKQSTKVAPKPAPQKTKANTNTKQVEADLDKMQM